MGIWRLFTRSWPRVSSVILSLEFETIRSMHDIKTVAPAVTGLSALITEEPGRDGVIGARTMPKIYGEGDVNFLLSFEMRLLSRLRSALALVENISRMGGAMSRLDQKS